MRAWTSARFSVPLPPGHRFPMAKYALIAEGVVARGIVPREGLAEPSRASREALTRVHDAGYVDAVLENGLTEAEQRRHHAWLNHEGFGVKRFCQLWLPLIDVDSPQPHERRHIVRLDAQRALERGDGLRRFGLREVHVPEVVRPAHLARFERLRTEVERFGRFEVLGGHEELSSITVRARGSG